MAQNTPGPEKNFAEGVINNLGKYKNRVKLTYTLRGSGNESDIDLLFSLTPTYSETDKITGNSINEILANISQKDSLAETTADEDRCGPASLINAYLLMGGSFSKLAAKTGIEKGFTYKNLHLLQEKIYNLANNDGEKGIESGFKYTSNVETGEISNVRASGEIVRAAFLVGLNLKPLVGSNIRTIYRRKAVIEKFFREHPGGVLQVGVNLNVKTGWLYAPMPGSPQDHSIIVYKFNHNFFMADTSGVNNGNRENVKRFTQSGMNSLVYNTSGIINGLTLLQ